MDFSQLYKTVDTVAPGYESGVFTPTHLTVLTLELLFIALMAVLFVRSAPQRRGKILFSLATFVILNEILKDLYLLALGELQWMHMPLHLCGINVLAITAYQWSKKKKLAEWLYAMSLPGGLVALISPDWSKLPVLNIMYLQTNTIHTALVLFPILLLLSGFRPSGRRFLSIAPILFLIAALIYPLNKILETNFLFLNWAPIGTPFAAFEELLGNPGYLLAFGALLLFVWLLMYLPWRTK